MRGKYFDEFEVGERFETLGRTVTEPDLVSWQHVVGLHTEMFTDRVYAREESVFGQVVIPATLTASLADGLFTQTQLLQGTSIAFLGEQLRALSPLFIGDTIHVEIEVVDKKRASRPDRGVITFLHTVTNQHGRPIITFNATYMMHRDPELVEAEEEAEEEE